MVDEAGFEVVRSEVEGHWAVRRAGEEQALSTHASREQAEEGARLHSEQGAEVDVRQDALSDVTIDDASGVKRTGLTLGMMLAIVTAILIAVALIAALTGFGA